MTWSQNGMDPFQFCDRNYLDFWDSLIFLTTSLWFIWTNKSFNMWFNTWELNTEKEGVLFNKMFKTIQRLWTRLYVRGTKLLPFCFFFKWINNDKTPVINLELLQTSVGKTIPNLGWITRPNLQTSKIWLLVYNKPGSC